MELQMNMKNEYVEFEKKKKDLEDEIKVLKSKNAFYLCIVPSPLGFGNGFLFQLFAINLAEIHLVLQ
ncbi:hypothetical protein Tco_1581944, partial [Tanacetum coccineum]